MIICSTVLGMLETGDERCTYRVGRSELIERAGLESLESEPVNHPSADSKFGQVIRQVREVLAVTARDHFVEHLPRL